MPGLVPKFAFLVPEMDLWFSAIWGFFQKLVFCTKSLGICFWFDSEGSGGAKHYSKGFFEACSNFGSEIRIFSAQKGLWGPAIWGFLKKNEFFLHKIRRHLFLHTYIGIFMVSIGHYGGSLLTLFWIFRKFSFLAVWRPFWRPFLGQNSPQNWHFH